jgi:hypothetical protein
MPMPDEPEHDGLPPADFVFPSKPSELDERIELMLLDLQHIANGDAVAYRTSTILCSLQGAVTRCAPRLSGNQRDRMLSGFARARHQIMGLFALAHDVELACAGFDAIAGLIIWWSESAHDRAGRPQHFFVDLNAHIRCLRNNCHNIALIEQVRERSRGRREKTIAEIYRKAVA